MHKQSSYQNSSIFKFTEKIKNINIYFNSVIQNYLHLIKKISYEFSRINKKIEISFLVMILPFDTRKVPHFLIFSKVLSIL